MGLSPSVLAGGDDGGVDVSGGGHLSNCKKPLVKRKRKEIIIINVPKDSRHVTSTRLEPCMRRCWGDVVTRGADMFAAFFL